MADLKQIQFKRSNTAGKRPLPADIAEGELAINIKDATMFTKNADGIVIDLGFAKGGNIDGNVVQKGDYTQTGNYNLTGNIDVSGYVKAVGDLSGANLNVTTNVNAGREIISANGTFRSRALGNAHFWMEGTESGAPKERALLYADPQTETIGRAILRVQNGYGAGQPSRQYTFNGDGTLGLQKVIANVELEAPTVVANLVDHYKKTFVQGAATAGYDSSSLVNYAYVPATDPDVGGLNYLRKFRAYSGATIFHEIVDARNAGTNKTQNGAEISYWTGNGPSKKIWAFSEAGNAYGLNSISLGFAGISGFDTPSIAIGDNDTGIKWVSDGNLDIMGNSRQAICIRNGVITDGKRSGVTIQKLTNIQYQNDTNVHVMPAVNQALLQIDTSLDGNNAGNNGLTLLGYNSAGKYTHHFRGTGAAYFTMKGGVDIQEGGLSVNGITTLNADLKMINRVIEPGQIYLGNTGNNVARTRISQWADPAGTNHRFEIYAQTTVGSIRKNIMTADITNFTATTSPLMITFAGDLNVEGDVRINKTGITGIKGTSNKLILADHSNGNVTLSADGGDLYLGWHSATYTNPTTNVRVEAPLLSNVSTTLGNGSITWNTANGSARTFTARNWGNASRPAVLEFGDGASGANAGSYHFYSQRNTDNSVTFSAAGSFTCSGAATIGGIINTSTSGISTPGGGKMANDGNIYLNKAGFAGWIDALFLKTTGDVHLKSQALVSNGRGDGYYSRFDGDKTLNFQNAAATVMHAQIVAQGDSGIRFMTGGARRLLLRAVDNYSDVNISAPDVYIRSDIRLKSNFAPIENPVEKVEALTGLIYDKAECLGGEFQKREAGVIAQDLKSVLPEAVFETTDINGNEILTVSTQGQVALLIEAIKELSARVKELESK